jgi:uncharacterized protein (DUF488 family)
MRSTIYTIGFTKKTAEEFFRLLQDAGVHKLVDVRENRSGQLSGFAKYPDIAFFLERLLGISYAHEPRFAPSSEIREAYRRTRDWIAYEKSFVELMRARGVPEAIEPDEFKGNVALLCSENLPERCHRRLVAEMLANEWSPKGHQVNVEHLVLEKFPKRKRGKNDRANSV